MAQCSSSNSRSTSTAHACWPLPWEWGLQCAPYEPSVGPPQSMFWAAIRTLDRNCTLEAPPIAMPHRPLRCSGPVQAHACICGTHRSPTCSKVIPTCPDGVASSCGTPTDGVSAHSGGSGPAPLRAPPNPTHTAAGTHDKITMSQTSKSTHWYMHTHHVR